MQKCQTHFYNPLNPALITNIGVNMVAYVVYYFHNYNYYNYYNYYNSLLLTGLF